MQQKAARATGYPPPLPLSYRCLKLCPVAFPLLDRFRLAAVVQVAPLGDGFLDSSGSEAPGGSVHLQPPVGDLPSQAGPFSTASPRAVARYLYSADAPSPNSSVIVRWVRVNLGHDQPGRVPVGIGVPKLPAMYTSPSPVSVASGTVRLKLHRDHRAVRITTSSRSSARIRFVRVRPTAETA